MRRTLFRGAVTYRSGSFKLPPQHPCLPRGPFTLEPNLRDSGMLNTEKGLEGVELAADALTLSQTLLSRVEKWKDVSKLGTGR